ncbi:MAG: helix-turn-helix domain-containing protein [Candidatus Nanoarchaeia archaeon]
MDDDRLIAIIFRSLLAAAGIFALLEALWLDFALVSFMLFLTILPSLIDGRWKQYFPSGFDLLILLFIYVSISLSKMTFLLDAFWWWIIVTDATKSVVIGLIGFSLVIILNYEKSSVIRLSPNFVALFAFCFAITGGAAWELFEAILFFIFNVPLDKFGVVTVRDMGIDAIGAFVVSFFGYLALKVKNKSIVIKLMTGLSRENPILFPEFTSRQAYLKKLIRQGEHDQLEFKATLRTNLHTGQADKMMVFSVLKTVVAYLNTEGGTLLVGVRDDGSIQGVEAEQFGSNDRLHLYITSLLKKNIGNEFVPFIRSKIVPLKGKYILKIDCLSSNKQVFLKQNNQEEFYIRNGPASVKLEGSKLIEYIRRRYRK